MKPGEKDGFIIFFEGIRAPVQILHDDFLIGNQNPQGPDNYVTTHTQNLAAVASHQSWMSGTVALVDDKDSIQALLDSRHQGSDFDYSKVLKTINVYLLRGDFLSSYFVPHLDAFIASGDVNEFNEAIFHAMTYRQTHTLRAVRCDDIKWFEIDDENDRTAME